MLRSVFKGMLGMERRWKIRGMTNSTIDADEDYEDDAEDGEDDAEVTTPKTTPIFLRFPDSGRRKWRRVTTS